jgi:hypothetical protein
MKPALWQEPVADYLKGGKRVQRGQAQKRPFLTGTGTKFAADCGVARRFILFPKDPWGRAG